MPKNINIFTKVKYEKVSNFRKHVESTVLVNYDKTTYICTYINYIMLYILNVQQLHLIYNNL